MRTSKRMTRILHSYLPHFATVSPEIVAHLQSHCWMVTGGSPPIARIKSLDFGVDLLICTPGRLHDLVNKPDKYTGQARWWHGHWMKVVGKGIGIVGRIRGIEPSESTLWLLVVAFLLFTVELSIIWLSLTGSVYSWYVETAISPTTTVSCNHINITSRAGFRCFQGLNRVPACII